MSRCHSIAILLIMVILTVACPVTADSAMVIQIPDEVVVSGLKFGLKDLGEICGGSEADRKLLDLINLGSVPPPGQVRVLNRSYLEFILARYAFLQRPQLKMGIQVTVRADAFCVKRQTIESTIRELITSDEAAGIERWVELNNIPGDIWLPQGNWQVKAEPAGKLPLIGRVVFKVNISNGSTAKDINVSGVIHAKAFIYRAVRDLQRHQALKPEDFLAEKVELRGTEYIGKLPERIRSTTAIRKGEILAERQFEESPLVNKDSEVIVVVKNGGFDIKLTAIAQKDGWFGQTIMLMNPVSKKIFTGKVIAMDTVEVTVK